jgi:ribonucleoside-diphosphate reductase alpha chain
MHTERKRLPNRRSAETWDVEALGLHFKTSVGRYDDGRIGEIFLSNHRVNSMAGIMASDSAVLCSLLLQYGVPLDVIRHALMRDPRGKPSGPLGVVLDQLAQEGTA